MFTLKRKYKIGIMLLGTLCFTAIKINLPFQQANHIICASFIISEIPHLKVLIKSAKGTIVWKLMGISILITLITILTSPHLSKFNDIRYYLQDYLFFYYFGLMYAFWCFQDEETIQPSLKITFVGIIILTFFGVANYITKTADFVTLMEDGWTNNNSSDIDIGESYTTSDRFRVMAMFHNPFDYGYICIIILLLHIYGFTRGYENRTKLIVVLICTIFGILTNGSRTIIFCSFVGVSVYFLLAFKPKKTLRIILLCLFILPISYQLVPQVRDPIDKAFTMFDKNSDYEGSSIEMRTLQYATIFYYIQDNPLFGRGYKFFSIDLGWSEGRKYLKDDRLQGLEGVAMSYLLERGIIGYTLYLIFWISIVVYMFRNRKASKQATALGLSILAVYLSFANMTGELSSVYPTLLILGFCIKAIETKKNKEKSIRQLIY